MQNNVQQKAANIVLPIQKSKNRILLKVFIIFLIYIILYLLYSIINSYTNFFYSDIFLSGDENTKAFKLMGSGRKELSDRGERILKARKENGDIEADFFLGATYERLGLYYSMRFDSATGEEYLSRASYHYKNAIENGFEYASYKYARSLDEGWADKKRHQDQAALFYKKSIANKDDNHIISMLALTDILALGTNRKADIDIAIRYIKHAAESGDHIAQFALGNIFYTGRWHTIKDYYYAFIWFEKAAINNNETSQYYLAKMYNKGQGVMIDNCKSFIWLLISALNGSPLAVKRLEEFVRTGYILFS